MFKISLTINKYLVNMIYFATFKKKALKDIMRINIVRSMKSKPIKGRSTDYYFT